jgi:hypothetical protein
VRTNASAADTGGYAAAAGAGLGRPADRGRVRVHQVV